MNIEKINIKDLKKLIKEKEVNSATAKMLIADAQVLNDLVDAIQIDGVRILYLTREGNERYKVNPLLYAYYQSVKSVNNLMKSSGILVSKNDELKEKKLKKEEEKIEEKDSFQLFLNNIANN